MDATDKRAKRRDMLKEIAAGSTRYVFWTSMKLTDDKVRNCKFCGEEFIPGQQPDLLTLPDGWGYWRRTLCSEECAGLRRAMGTIERRANAIKNTRTKGVVVDLVTIRERDGFVCYLCGGQTVRGYEGPDRKLRPETDHIVPLSDGGIHHPNNLRCCCGRCNLAKGSKTLQTAIRIYSGGKIDFEQPNRKGGQPTLEELVIAWRQWVLPDLPK